MSNPISSMLAEVNENLRQTGADFTVGATVDVPVTISVGEEGKEIETHIEAEITESGIEIINADEQTGRIIGEMKRALDLDKNQSGPT